MAYGLDLSKLEDEDLNKPKYRGLDFNFETPMPELPSKPLPTTTGLNLATETPISSTTDTDFVSSIATPKKKSSFVDWWKGMDEDKRTALNRGLLATGLNMMALGGRTYDRPVSALGIVGEAGKAGLSQYEDTYDREQTHKLRKDYYDIAKERNQIQAKAYGLRLDAANKSAINKQDEKKTKALKRIAQIDEKIAKYAKNNSVVDSEAAKLLQLYGKNVSMGSTMDEESRQQIINSYNKERRALLPLAGEDTPSWDEEKRNIYKETYGLMKSGADKAMGLNISKGADFVDKGNINLYNRPQVKNTDGSISSVRSMSFNENGKEILIPTVSEDGRIMSNNEAIKQYKKTGKYLGKFNTVKEANQYADELHKQQESLTGQPQKKEWELYE